MSTRRHMAVLAGGLAVGLAVGLGIGRLEVRGTSYYHRLATGRALWAIQDGLDRGEVATVLAALKGAAGDSNSWLRVPTTTQIDMLSSMLAAHLDLARQVDSDH